MNKFFIKSTSDITMTLVTIAFVYIAIMDGSIFYYKYSRALNPKAASVEQKVKFYLDAYKKELETIIEDSSQITDRIIAYDQINDRFNEYLALKAINDVYLLKASDGGNMTILSSSDKSLIGENATFPECNINTSSDILKLTRGGLYLFKEILPENRMFACGFEPVGGYTLGIKNTFTENIKGFDDPNFKDWFIQNLSLTLVASLVGTIIVMAAYFWLLARYLSQQRYFEKVKSDDEEEKRRKEKFIYTDDETSLGNRKAFDKEMLVIKHPKVVLISIDDFSLMQEFYGDEVCKSVIGGLAEILKELSKEHKMSAYRIDYDKFCLLENKDIVYLDDYEDLANTIIERFKGRILRIEDGLLGDEIEVHTTIGMSLDDENTLSKAYVALRYATRNKKDFACFFKGLSNPEKYANQIKNSRIIKNAILNDNIVNFYQPIFDANKDLLRYEILMRINDTQDALPLNEILSVARTIKRYEDMQSIMLESAKADMLENPNINFAMNLNISDAFLQNIANDVLSLCDNEDIAKRLHVELIINEKIDDMPRLFKFVKKLKSRGVTIVLDDFGGEYNMSILNLANIQPSIIKVASIITKNIDTDENSRQILSTIVGFAHSSGMLVAVKHMHSKDVFEICKSIGADEFQGFYLGVPSNSLQRKKYGLS